MIAIIIVMYSLSCTAQSTDTTSQLPSDPLVDTGMRASATYEGVHDNVSLSSGNLSLCIPLFSLPGRHHLNLTIPLCYNSQFTEMVQQAGAEPVPLDAVSWFPWVWGKTTLPMGPGWTLTGRPGHYVNAGGGNVVFMPDGSKHTFPEQGGDGYDGQGTGISLISNGDILLKDGTYITPGNAPTYSSLVYDTNGNYIDFEPSYITDTVGRRVTVTASDATSTIPAYIAFKYPDSNGVTRTVTVQMATVSLSCNMATGQNIGNTRAYSMPTAVILPSGLTYTLQYDNCGELSKITYPGGGYTRYEYSFQPRAMYNTSETPPGIYGYQTNEISAKYVCTSASATMGSTSTGSGNTCAAAEEVTTYTPSVLGNSEEQFNNTQNVVVDPLGNKTIYQFTEASRQIYGAPALETSRQMYDASGHLMKTIQTQYTNTTIPYQNDPAAPAAFPSIQTTTLDNGMVSQIQWDYDLKAPWALDTVLTEQREYDFGSGSPGQLLQRTNYTWLHRDNTQYADSAVNILNRKTSEAVYNSSGTLMAKTVYEYDNYTSGISQSGAATNKAAYGASTLRGNLTAVKRWRNTDGTQLVTRYQYDDAGNVVSKADPNGNTTTYSYQDNFADGQNRSTAAFLTKTTYPAAGGVSHVTQSQYYWGSGKVAASCGENFAGTCAAGLTSAADYATYSYDLTGRTISAKTGDGGQSTTCYSEMGGGGCASGSYPLKVVSTEAIASSVAKVSTAVLDGVGRVIQTQLNSDPSCAGGTVSVDKTYDLDGRVSTVSNPYCSAKAGASTSGITTYTYDGLGRTTRLTHPDNSYAFSTYLGRAVLSADEGNGTTRVQRVSQTDALGRLAYVCEVSSTTQQGASNTPSSCGLDISANGFLTSYSYDTLGNLTSVTQGGVSRAFVYDSLSELRSANNPESRTTLYNSYDGDGNLLSKTDALGRTTSYSYDGLNRLTGKSYSDGTASACFQYDQNASGHGIGRLATEWTQSGTCSSTPPASSVITQRTFASYDLMGRVAVDQQCASPNNCSATPNQVNYGYDLAGDVTQFANGLSGNLALSFTSQSDSAGRLALLNGSESGGSSNMVNLFSASGYSPAGSLSDATIGEGITFHRSYNNRLLPTAEADTVATTPGTASVGITGAEQISAFSTGSITFSGSEQSTSSDGQTVYDNGRFIVYVTDLYAAPIYINYGQNDTPQTLAANLASDLTCTSSENVRGVASGSTVYLFSCAAGVNTNYVINASIDGHSSQFAQASFAVTTSGATMTPVINLPTSTAATAVTFAGTEQSGQTGNFLIFVLPSGGGAPLKTVMVSWGSTSTANSLATSLATALGTCSSGSTVTGTVSGPTVFVSSCSSGTTIVVSTAFLGYSGGTKASFVAVATTPAWAGVTSAAVYDAGTVALTINGTQVAYTTYNSASTAASITSALVSASSSNSLVNLTVNADNPAYMNIVAKGGGTDSDYTYALNTTYDTAHFSTPSFEASSASGSLVGGANEPLYSWSISSYAPDGDVLAMTEAVMGTWTYNYDDMNRLVSGTAAAGVDAGLILGWTYDRYGNRWAQNATGTGNATAVQGQLTFTGNNNRIDGWSYDAAGNLLYDYIHHYTYDAENRIVTLDGQPTYIYDAEGRRVAKLGAGGTVTASYVLGLGGEQVSELNGAGQWVHSNVFAGGKLLATYAGPGDTSALGYHYHLTDWLGTQRMQTNVNGNEEERCYSYPFGDGLNCTGSDATEHHFTSKERDAESGLDYFGARYLSSNLGRFMTPDWAAAPISVPYAQFGDPQSLNLYAYVGNNPNTGIDLDGHGPLDNGDGYNFGIVGLSGYEFHGDYFDLQHPNQFGGSSNSSNGGSSNSAPPPPAPSNPNPANPDPAAQQQRNNGNAAIKPTTFTFDPTLPTNVQITGSPTPTYGPLPDGMGAPAGTIFSGNTFPEQIVGLTGQPAQGNFTAVENIQFWGNAGPMVTNASPVGHTFTDYVGLTSPNGSFSGGLTVSIARQSFTVTLQNGISYGLSTIMSHSVWMVNGSIMQATSTVIIP